MTGMIQPDINNVITCLVDFQQIPGEELVTENNDGSYTILINSRISYERQIKAYQHVIGHIVITTLRKEDVQQIEAVAHERMPREAEPSKPMPRRYSSFASKQAKYEEWHRKLQNKHRGRYLDIMLGIIEEGSVGSRQVISGNEKANFSNSGSGIKRGQGKRYV